MAEDTDEADEGPAVSLGEGPAVPGVPLARVASRLTYGIEKSTVRSREGDTDIRTAAGPRRLGDVLDDVEASYFDRKQAFESAVREQLPDGPVATE